MDLQFWFIKDNFNKLPSPWGSYMHSIINMHIHTCSCPSAYTFFLKKYFIYLFLELSWIMIFLIYFIFIFKIFLKLFLAGKGGRKRGRETSMCGCLSHGPPWGPGPQPRHAPWLGIEPATLWFAGLRSIHWAIPARDAYTFNFASGLETSAFLLGFVLPHSPFIHSSFTSLRAYSQL